MKRQPVAETTAAADYGTAFVTTRDGRRAPARIGAGDGMELADVAFDKNTTVRVARRADPLLTILEPRRSNVEGRTRYLAAEQFRRDCAVADGAVGESERLGISGGGSGDGGRIAVLDAQTRVRRAWVSVRADDTDAETPDAIRLIVLGLFTPTAVDGSRRYIRGSARTLLLAGLDRLADHYGLITTR
jgi:hypothetical protein